MPTIDRPVDFSGTPDEAQANRRTHDWRVCDDEVRCARCDSKSWHVAANYPCGDEPPRELITYPED